MSVIIQGLVFRPQCQPTINLDYAIMYININNFTHQCIEL